MQKIIFLLLFFLTIPGLSNAESKKIVKWVDSSGNTHYGDQLPMQESGQNSTVISERGLLVKRNIAIDKKAESIDRETEKQKLDQARKDAVLLASYTDASEIDLALTRNLQMDQAFMQSLTQQKTNLNNRVARLNITSKSLKANKKPLPAYLSEELAVAQVESVKLDQMMTQRKVTMENTRKHFTQEKTRFIALKQPLAQASPLASEPVNAPSKELSKPL